jgi:hypothetical protein
MGDPDPSHSQIAIPAQIRVEPDAAPLRPSEAPPEALPSEAL